MSIIKIVIFSVNAAMLELSYDLKLYMMNPEAGRYNLKNEGYI